MRIDHAGALISTEDSILDEIADMLGFYDCSHLCRVYKRLRGHTLGQGKNR